MNITGKVNVKNIRNFFWWSAGIVISVLEKCPTEQTKYTAIGILMLFIVGLSCLSFSYFLSYTFDANPLVAFGGGMFWAFLIFCLERVVLTSFRKGETGIPAIVLRFVLVISTAFVIGEPIALRIFEKEINLALMTRGRGTVTKAREEVTARFQGEINTLDKEKTEIQNRLDALKKDRDEKQSAITEEVEGKSRTGRSGYGIAAKQKENAFNDADGKYKEFSAESAEILRLNNERLAEIRREIDTQTKLTAEADKGANGTLARHEALFSIVTGSFGAALNYIPIFLIFTLVETLPFSLKVFSKKGVYEEMLEAEEAKHIAEIKERNAFENENLIRSRDLQKAIAERIWAGLANGNIEKIVDNNEKRVAVILQNEALQTIEKEAFDRIVHSIAEEKFGEAIIVEVIGSEEFEFVCEMPKKAQKTLSLDTLGGDIAKISEKVGKNLQLTNAFSSAGRVISASLPLLAQIENDRKILLQFEPCEV